MGPRIKSDHEQAHAGTTAPPRRRSRLRRSRVIDRIACRAVRRPSQPQSHRARRSSGAVVFVGGRPGDPCGVSARCIWSSQPRQRGCCGFVGRAVPCRPSTREDMMRLRRAGTLHHTACLGAEEQLLDVTEPADGSGRRLSPPQPIAYNAARGHSA
jgi:hypothetical protein